MYSFYLFDDLGSPIVGATPAFSAYRSLGGVELTPRPAITNLASNIYTFAPSVADEAGGVAFMIYASTATPQYYAGAVGNLAAFGVWDDVTLAPKTTAVPVMDVYVGADATPHTLPSIANIGLGLYGWMPSNADRTNDVQFRGRTVTAGCIPANFEGSVATATGGGSGVGPTLLSVAPFGDRLELTFSANVVLSGPALLPAQWSVTSSSPTATIPAFTSITVAGAAVTLYATECTNGAPYYLHVPTSGIADLSAVPFGGPWLQPYTGVGIVPFVALASASDALHAKVIFSEPVVGAEAVVPANYVITGGAGLTVYAATKETDSVYVLTTSLQVMGQSYTVTVSNIHDLYGNLI